MSRPCAPATRWKHEQRVTHHLVDGHLACPASHLNLPPHLHIIADGNSKNAFYPSKQKYVLAYVTAFNRWCTHHHLPHVHQQWLEDHASLHWNTHKQYGKAVFDASALHALKECTGNLVWHCEDHAAHRLMVFCPTQYHRMLDNTWCNSEIFEEMAGINPLQHHDNKVHAIRRSLPRFFTTTVASLQPIFCRSAKTVLCWPPHHFVRRLLRQKAVHSHRLLATSTCGRGVSPIPPASRRVATPYNDSTLLP